MLLFLCKVCMKKFGDAEKKKQDLITCVHSKFDALLSVNGSLVDGHPFRLSFHCASITPSRERPPRCNAGLCCTAVSLLCITLAHSL